MLSSILGLTQAGIGGLQAILGASKLKSAQKAATEAISAIETQQVDPLVAARYNMPMPGEEEAKMDIGQAATAAAGQAKNLKSGLKSIGVNEANRIKGLQGLAKQKAQYKLGAEQNLVAQKEKAFKSRQEKQQLQANIALQDVAAQRSAVSQGLAGLTGGLSNAAYGMFGGGGGKNSFNTNTSQPIDYSSIMV
jgi:hypothetical protein